MSKARGPSSGSRIEPLKPEDWDFSEVPDEELVACCYWEYARESAFIRDVKRRCIDPRWREMTKTQLWEHCGFDLERVQSIGYPSEVFLSGFFFDEEEDRKPCHPDAPPITGAFPAPWLKLTREERRSRSRIGSDVSRIPLIPFQRGHAMDAKDIRDSVEARRKEHDAANARVRRENPDASEEILCREGKLRFPPIQPSMYWAGGMEMTIVHIEWTSFTNEQIVTCFRQWVKENRPQRMAAPNNQGHKPRDWRAHLTRLAAMRLLSRFTASQLTVGDRFPPVWETKPFSMRKWQSETKWHDARREAGKIFRELLPFLPEDEKPRSWERRPPGK